MKKKLLAGLAALAVLAFAASAATAKDVKLPDDKPVVSFTLPDDWSPKDIDNGAEATSPDGSTYVAFELTDAKDLSALVAEDVKYLIKQGVEIDQSTKKQSEGDINGMKGVSFEFAGKDKDGPTQVSLTVVLPASEKALLITYWGSKEGEQKNGAALDAIVKSVKPAS